MLLETSREDKLNKILTNVHVILIVFAGIFAYFDGFATVPFVYLVVFYINEYMFILYRDGNDDKKRKVAKWYMLSSASLIIWLVILIYLPNMIHSSWLAGGSMWTMLYTIFVLLAAIVMLALNWIRKITTA